jgi:transposase
MMVGVEASLGFQAPGSVCEVDLFVGKRRIDFTVTCGQQGLACPQCGTPEQSIHDRVTKQWRHLDFLQFEAWLHAKVPQVKFNSCGKTTQTEVPWVRPGSGFTLLFEVPGLSLYAYLLVRQATSMLRLAAKRLMSRLEHYVHEACAKQGVREVCVVGIDETSVKQGHKYITVVHDLAQKRLLFVCAGRHHEMLADFAQDLKDYDDEPEAIEHACMDMNGAHLNKGVTATLPKAQLSHVIALTNAAMDEVRRSAQRADAPAVNCALSATNRKVLESLMWGMHKNSQGWSDKQTQAMHWLQHANVRSTLAWRLKQPLREVYAQAAQGNDVSQAERLPGVVRGMLDGRSNAHVKSINGVLQQTEAGARGFRAVRKFIAIAYLRMAKLKGMHANPFAAAPFDMGLTRHACWGQVPLETA